MRGHSDEWIVNRVRWKLRGFANLPSDVLRFDTVECAATQALRRIAVERGAGLPIMAVWRSDELWTLLGSERLVWRRSGQIEELLLDEVKWADVPGMLDVMRRELEMGVEAEVAARHKIHHASLRVIDKSETEHVLWTSHSGGCLRLWNVLLMLIGMQKCAH